MHFAQSEFEAPLWNKLAASLHPAARRLRVDVGPAAAYDFSQRGEGAGRPSRRPRRIALGDRFSAVDVLLGDMGCAGRGLEDSASDPTASTPISTACLSRPARARWRRPMEDRSDAAGRFLARSAPKFTAIRGRRPLRHRRSGARPAPSAPQGHRARAWRQGAGRPARAAGSNHGDVLVLEDGRHAEIIAAEEELYDIRAATPCISPSSPGTSATATLPPRSRLSAS